MEKLAILLLLFPVIGLSQVPYSYVTTIQNNSYQAITTSNDYVVAAGSIGYCATPSLEFFSKTTGASLSGTIYPTYNYGWFIDACVQDDIIWATGKTVYADDVWLDPKSILAGCVGTDIVYQYEIEDIWAWEGSPSVQSLQEEGVLWNTGSKLYIVLTEEGLIDSILFDDPIEYVGVLDDTTFLIQQREGNTLDIINSSGEILINVSTDEGIKAVANTEEYIYYLTEESIVGIALEDFSIDSHLLEEGHLFNRLATKGKDVILYAKDVYNPLLAIYSKYTDEFTALPSWGNEERRISKLITEGDIYYLTGIETFAEGVYTPQNGYIQAFYSPDNLLTGIDLGIVNLNLQLDSAYIVHNEFTGTYKRHLVGGAKFEIHNYDTIPFEGNFLIISNITWGFNCAIERYYELHTAQINPGESEWIQLDIHETDIYSDNIPPEYYLDGTLSRCYFIGAPNNLPDINPYNNEECDAIAFVISSNHDAYIEKAALEVYPNPVRDVLTISYEKGSIDYIKLINVQGQFVSCPIEKTTGKIQLLLNHMPTGMYALLVATKNGIISRKIMVSAKTN